MRHVFRLFIDGKEYGKYKNYTSTDMYYENLGLYETVIKFSDAINTREGTCGNCKNFTYLTGVHEDQEIFMPFCLDCKQTRCLEGAILDVPMVCFVAK